MTKMTGLISTATLSLSLVLTAGCRVDEHKDGTGKGDNVKIETPFGGMSVKTNESVVQGGTGLTPYPGATVEKKKDKNNDSAADVNMSFGSFHLGVKAISYTTPDAPDKVLAFYRKDMTRFGTVILCQGSAAVGMPDHTQDGLGCDKSKHSNINVGDDDAQQELKAGSKQHQHIVSIEPNGAGTKIGLVNLDLPKGIDSDGKESQ